MLLFINIYCRNHPFKTSNYSDNQIVRLVQWLIRNFRLVSVRHEDVSWSFFRRLCLWGRGFRVHGDPGESVLHNRTSQASNDDKRRHLNKIIIKQLKKGTNNKDSKMFQIEDHEKHRKKKKKNTFEHFILRSFRFNQHCPNFHLDLLGDLFTVTRSVLARDFMVNGHCPEGNG